MAIIRVDFQARTASLINGVKKAQKAVKTSSDQISRSLKTSAKAATAATAAAGAAMIALGVRQAGVIDETAKLSKALGVNIREFQALAMVADESGITQDNLGNIITRSQRSIVEASRGIATYARSFETLGLNVQEILRLSPDQQFNRIAMALAEIENPTLRTATALEIYGRSGRQVINMLDGYVSGIQEAREFNDKFNISLTEIDASKVEEANDTFGRLGKAVSGLGNTLAVELAPVVTAVSNNLLEAGVDGTTFGAAVSRGMELAARAIDLVRIASLGVKAIFIEVIAGLNDMIARASLVLHDFFSEVVQNMNRLPGVNREIKSTFLDIGLAARMSEQKATKSLEALESKAAGFSSAVEGLARVRAEADARAAEAASKAADSAGDLAHNLEEAASAAQKVAEKTEKSKISVKDLGDESEKAINKISESSNKAGSAFDGIFSRAQGALNDFLNTGEIDFKNFISSITAELNNLATSQVLSSLKGVFGGSVDFLSNGSSSGGSSFLSGIGSIFGLDMFAQGGVTSRPALFGEAGPEAAVPLPDGRSIPVDLRGNGGGDTFNINMTINGVTDYDSFRRSESQIAARMYDVMTRAGRRNG